jgi:hypothetical protein
MMDEDKTITSILQLHLAKGRRKLTFQKYYVYSL